MKTVYIAAAELEDYPKCLTDGWYVWDGTNYDGPFAEWAEAWRFMELCEEDDRIERRHEMSVANSL